VQTLTSQRAQLQAEYQEKLGIFQPDYPQMVQYRARIQSLDNAIAQETRNVTSSLRSELAGAQARENALASRVEGLKTGLLNLRQRSIQYTILQREVDTNRALYDTLLQRYREVGVAGGVGQNVVSIVDRAMVPGAPFKPNLPLNIILGFLAGIVLGFGAAFALEWMDDTIKTPDDLPNKLGLAPLGVIPVAQKSDTPMDSLDDSRSQISEAYQSVRTALQFSTDHGVPRTLAITSTRAGEGKSTSALSVARAISTLDARVLLIDADLRKPTFKGPSGQSAGLSSLLAGRRSWKPASTRPISRICICSRRPYSAQPGGAAGRRPADTPAGTGARAVRLCHSRLPSGAWPGGCAAAGRASGRRDRGF
jgi:hypothetical protein